MLEDGNGFVVPAKLEESNRHFVTEAQIGRVGFRGKLILRKFVLRTLAAEIHEFFLQLRI